MYMMTNNKFKVELPVELFEEFLKYQGVQDGEMMEHQSVTVNDIKYNMSTGYLEIDGDLWKKEDA